MKLYYSPSASSLAAHIVMREADRRFDLERVDVKSHRAASGADYLQINPKGDVPALQLDGPHSEILTEAPVILEYIGDLAAEKRLVPPAGTFARYHLEEWLSFISSELHHDLWALCSAEIPASYRQQLRGRISERFVYLEQVLVDRAYLMGETFTVADAYLFAMLQWCDKAELDLPLWPNLEDFEFRVSQRPSVIAAMHEEGVAGRHHWKRSA